jgi:hypothetical protein
MVPLSFWFTPRRPSPEDIIESFPNITTIRTQLDILDTLHLDVLKTLKDMIYELQSYYMDKLSILFLGGPYPFSEDINRVVAAINKYSIDGFTDTLVFSSTEYINGYQLYDSTTFIFEWDYFKSLWDMWIKETNKEIIFKTNVQKILNEYVINDISSIILDYLPKFQSYGYEKFCGKYDRTACTDWNKINRHGNSFGGFWDYPDGSKEKENASALTRIDNGNALWELPYPRSIIYETINMGCLNRCESVRYSNFVCEWIKRKIEQINKKHTC